MEFSKWACGTSVECQQRFVSPGITDREPDLPAINDSGAVVQRAKH
jgi:hypothetical protein